MNRIKKTGGILFFLMGVTMSTPTVAQTFPLEKEGSHYFIATTLNEIDTKLMLESGVPALIIDSTFYEVHKAQLKGTFTPNQKSLVLLNKKHRILKEYQGTIALGEAHYQGPVFVVAGECAPMLPFQYLKSEADSSSIVKIDLPTKVLEVMTRPQLQACHLTRFYPLHFNKRGKMPVISTSIGLTAQGKNETLSGDFILDYGNGSHLFLLKENEAVKEMLEKSGFKLSDAKNKQGVVVAQGLLAETMQLFEEDFQQVSIGITNKMKFDGEAGLIGLKSLNRCLVFDMDDAKLYFVK